MFEGFAAPKKNYFPMPNCWTDITAGIENLAELKIVEYVLRHTWGYREYNIKKVITVEEFMYGRKRADGSRIDRGTGLKSDRSVKDGIRAAIEHGYIVCDVDESDRGRIRKAYALKMQAPDDDDEEAEDDTEVDTTPHANRRVEPTPLAGSKENRGVESTRQRGSKRPSVAQHLPPNEVESAPRTEKNTLEKHREKNTLEKHFSVAPTGAEVGFDVFFEKEDSASPEEDAWSAEGIQNIAACFLSPLPTMRKEQKAEALANWQAAAVQICNHSTWVSHHEDERPTIFTGMLQFVTDPTSPCKYRAWWLERFGSLESIRLWHIANRLYPIYQDYMKCSWQPQGSGNQSEAMTTWEVPMPEQEARPAPVIDTEPEPTVTPEPVVTPAAESLPALTLEEAKAYTAIIRVERDAYSVQRYACPGGFYLEAAVSAERTHQIFDQASFDRFMEKTRPRTPEERHALMQAALRRLPARLPEKEERVGRARRQRYTTGESRMALSGT